ANPIADQSAVTSASFSFTVPANAFTDLDNATLTYSATLDGGTALPSWLSFNASTRTFSGTPTATSGSPFNIRVTASDGSGGSVSDVFSLLVSSGNVAPVATNGSDTTAEDSALSGSLPAATDANGDSITYAQVSGSGPSNGTVVISPNGTYVYTPKANFSGNDTFSFVINDGKGGSNMSVAQNASAPSGAVGVLVSSLLGGVTDPDTGALKGMAIIGTNTTVGGAVGNLSYSVNNGASWAAVGAASPTSALLLPAEARLYFQPSSGSTGGTLGDLLTFRAWDQSAPSSASGTRVSITANGGSSAFSTATDAVALTVTSVANTTPPVLQASALDNVTNLDPTSNIILNYDVGVTAVAGKNIRIVNDGGSGAVSAAYTLGAGFRGENAINTLSIAANDGSQV
ncbi:MAG: hypothetical protein EBU75_12435, partial [Betaproteobacteria bacterium]|nr:hypothetical protein [Betaproteobacteria bacterium]